MLCSRQPCSACSGDSVRLHGLHTDGLNGAEGTVHGLANTHAGQYHVKLHSGCIAWEMSRLYSGCIAWKMSHCWHLSACTHAHCTFNAQPVYLLTQFPSFFISVKPAGLRAFLWLQAPLGL